MLPERFEFLKSISFIKNRNGASKIKSSTKNLTRMIYETFILEPYLGLFHFDISIALLL